MSNESLRIFRNNLLESLTHVHPIVPLALWSPIIGYLMYLGLAERSLSVLEFSLVGFVGLVIWTFTEYILHRFMFHFPGTSKASRVFVFLFHGLHHDDPNDKTRLVMPPFPALVIVGLLTLFFGLIVPTKYLEVFMAFFLIGYLVYDYIHYATHHFKMNNKVGKYLKRYHLEHHYSAESSKYGVSSPLWDYIFNTVNGPKKRAKYDHDDLKLPW